MLLPQAFTGAYYRKIGSPASSEFFGIRAEGVLPSFQLDPTRYFVEPAAVTTDREGINHFRTGPLDRPSIYLGGNGSGHELDAGLCFDRVYDENGEPTFTNDPSGCHGGDEAKLFARIGRKLVDGTGKLIRDDVSWEELGGLGFRPNFAFRPFYRTTNHLVDEEGKPIPEWFNPKPGAMDNLYFFPKDPIVMAIRVLGKERVRLDIRTQDSKRAFHVIFRALGFAPFVAHSFKRVNAVDQFRVENGKRVGNEKQPLIHTKTRVTEAVWSRVFLLNSKDEQFKALSGPNFLQAFPAQLERVFEAVFQSQASDAEIALGGETLSINADQFAG